MADCYAPEMEDLHRRWLPREIFADIGIADAAPPSPDAEDIAARLTAGIIGVGGGKAAAPRPTPSPRPASYQQHHAAQVCGLEGRVFVAYGGGSNGHGAAAAARPFLPYSPVQWQVATNFGGGAGFLGPRHAALRPCRGPPPAKRRLGGTGVFLPRSEVYQYQHKPATKSPARDVKPQQQQQRRDEDATGRRHQWQQVETAAAEMVQQQQNASAALLALPQEWTY